MYFPPNTTLRQDALVFFEQQRKVAKIVNEYDSIYARAGTDAAKRKSHLSTELMIENTRLSNMLHEAVKKHNLPSNEAWRKEVDTVRRKERNVKVATSGADVVNQLMLGWDKA